jgi:dipeptidyl aminopeptidase/acylaminoacyl peptidase
MRPRKISSQSQPTTATRRESLTALSLVGLLACPGLAGAAATPVREGRRLPTIEDYLALESVGLVRPSPDGRWLAVEIARARARPAVHRDDIGETRSDIWLVDLARGSLRRVTHGAATGAGVWAPIWSPDNATLAVLTNTGFRGTRAAFLELRSGRLRICGEGAVATGANFGSRSPGIPDGRVWGAWRTPGEFVTVLLPPGEANPEDEVGDPAPLYDPLWAKTRRGALSVTAWDSRAPAVCRAQARLVSLDARGRLSRVLVQGSVRAVNLSPDGGHAAVVAATRPRPVPGEAQSIGYAFGMNAYDLDILVETELWICSLAEGRVLGVAPGVSDLGFVDSRRHPQWAASGDFLAAPVLTDDQRNLVHRITVTSLEVETFPARSPLDAELLAALVVRGDPRTPAAQWVERLDVTREREPEHRMWTPGAVLSFQGHDLAVVISEGLVAVDRGGRPIERVVLDGATLSAWRPPPTPTGAAVFRSARGAFAVERWDGRLRRREVPIPPEPGATTWAVLADGSVCWAAKRQASRLWISKADGTAARPLVTRNPGLSALWRPQVQRFDYRLPDGTPAIGALLLPPDHTPDRPFPLVIHGYASQQVSLDYLRDAGELRPGSEHPILLCAQGYVVAIPSLPTAPESMPMDPLDHFASQVEAFAAALLRQEVASQGRIGFFGHSYGGFTALAVAARSKLVNAVVAYSPFADLIGQHDVPSRYFERDDCAPNVTRYGAVEEEAPNAGVLRIGGTPERLLSKYIANSPRFRLGSASPPLLMIQGEQDARGFRQVDAVYMVLSRLGVPVRLLRYWAEGHGIESPDNLRNAQKEISAWFDRYLLRPAGGRPAGAS